MPGIEKPTQEPQAQEQAPRHEDKLTAAVAAAYDKAQAAMPPEPASAVAPATAPAATPAPAQGERARDPETGKFTKAPERPQPAKPAAASGRAVPTAASAPAAAGPANAAPPKPEGQVEEPGAKERDLPPQSWRAPAKALWPKLPPEFAPLKAEALRMEREREAVLRDSARARRAEAEFQQTVEPFKQFIDAAGHTPMQSVTELMKTAAALQTLPAWEKAVLVASIARAHEVDPEMLVTAFQAGVPMVGPTSAEVRDPRVDELLADVQQAREAVEAETTQAADHELDDFIAAHPLAGDPDVQLRMARAVDLAWEDGVDLGYAEAYDGVLAVDSQLRALAEQQAAGSVATNPSGSTARAEAAASSTRPSPVAEAPRDLRGQKLEAHVAAAYDKAVARR